MGQLEPMVDGQIVVRDRKALNLDEQDAAQAVQEAGERTWPQMGAADWANPDADQLSPQSFPIWEEPAVSGHESPPLARPAADHSCTS